MLFQLSEHSSPGERDRDRHTPGMGHRAGMDVAAGDVWSRDGRWWQGWDMVSLVGWGGREGVLWQGGDAVAGMG